MNNTINSSTVSLTENELTFLKMCLNYSNIQSQLDDNFSNGGIDEAMELFEGTKQYRRQAAGGLISSLQKKGMGYLDTEYDQFVLTDAAIYAAFGR